MSPASCSTMHASRVCPSCASSCPAVSLRWSRRSGSAAGASMALSVLLTDSPKCLVMVLRCRLYEHTAKHIAMAMRIAMRGDSATRKGPAPPRDRTPHPSPTAPGTAAPHPFSAAPPAVPVTRRVRARRRHLPRIGHRRPDLLRPRLPPFRLSLRLRIRPGHRPTPRGWPRGGGWPARAGSVRRPRGGCDRSAPAGPCGSSPRTAWTARGP